MMNEQRYAEYLSVPVTKRIAQGSGDVESGQVEEKEVVVGFRSIFDRGNCLSNCWEFWCDHGMGIRRDGSKDEMELAPILDHPKNPPSTKETLLDGLVDKLFKVMFPRRSAQLKQF